MAPTKPNLLDSPVVSARGLSFFYRSLRPETILKTRLIFGLIAVSQQPKLEVESRQRLKAAVATPQQRQCAKMEWVGHPKVPEWGHRPGSQGPEQIGLFRSFPAKFEQNMVCRFTDNRVF